MVPNTVLYSFFLECNLGYPDRTGYQFEFNNENVTISFERKKYLSRHQFSETETNWESGDHEVIDTRFDGDETAYQSNYWSKGDAFSMGYLRRRIGTVVTIRFSTSISDEDQQKFAQSCLDYFLDVYRLVTFFGHAENHSKLISTIEEVEKGHLIGNMFRTEGGKTVAFRHSEPKPNLHSQFQIEESEGRRISDRLMIGTNLEVYENLICEGKKLIMNDNNYTLSIVVLETAVEAFIQKKLKKLCCIRSKMKLRYRNRNVKFEEVIEKANIKALINKFIPEITGQKIDRTIFEKWELDLYDVRNGIIHRGDLRHSKQEAEKAYKAMFDMIYHINGIN